MHLSHRFALLLLLGHCRASEEREFAGSFANDIERSGKVHELTLVAEPTTLPLLDGRQLDVWAYNGQVPGPIVRVRIGTTLRVHFTNKLPQPTTIHWHGIRLPNGMDGVPGVTQPPIEPDTSFTYDFTPKDAGTFWFHPHVRGSEQVERGLFGVLIVEDADPLPYSHELVWVLDDWLLSPDGQINPAFNTRHDLMHDGRWGNVLTINGQVRPSVPLRAGERLRLRLLNVANGRVFAPDFSGLDAKVVAFDGLYTAEPIEPSRLEMAPGNRADLDITIPRTWAGRTIDIADRFGRSSQSIARIVIVDETVETPRFPTPSLAKFPAWSRAAAIEPAHVFALNSRAGGPFGIEWMLNAEAFRHDGTTHSHHREYPLSQGRFAKLRFVNESFRLHPMHLHGQFFKVVARGGQPVDERHWRDTVLVRPKETVDVALVSQDRGLWMLHCHILEHAESGMMTLIRVD